MNWFRIFLLLFFIYSCRHFDKSYYEKISHVKFPQKYKIVASADNGEFMTIAILDLDGPTCKRFISDNNFLPVDSAYPVNLMALSLLDSSFRELPATQQLFRKYVAKVPGKVGWTYLIDTSSGRLYCEIDYPDFGGN